MMVKVENLKAGNIIKYGTLEREVKTIEQTPKMVNIYFVNGGKERRKKGFEYEVINETKHIKPTKTQNKSKFDNIESPLAGMENIGQFRKTTNEAIETRNNNHLLTRMAEMRR